MFHWSRGVSFYSRLLHGLNFSRQNVSDVFNSSLKWLFKKQTFFHTQLSFAIGGNLQTPEEIRVEEGSSTSLVKKFTSKVHGVTFVHFYLKVIPLDEKVGYKQEKSSSEGIAFWERLRDTETFWKLSLLWASGNLLPINIVFLHTSLELLSLGKKCKGIGWYRQILWVKY